MSYSIEEALATAETTINSSGAEKESFREYNKLVRRLYFFNIYQPVGTRML